MREGATPPSKPCAVCGREIAWRKRWARTWEAVKYCSARCRGARGGVRDGHEERILALLSARAAGATICPSEVLPLERRSDREEMERVREAARRLVHAGRLEIVQRGQVVDPSAFRGPIRLRLRRGAPG